MLGASHAEADSSTPVTGFSYLFDRLHTLQAGVLPSRLPYRSQYDAWQEEARRAGEEGRAWSEGDTAAFLAAPPPPTPGELPAAEELSLVQSCILLLAAACGASWESLWQEGARVEQGGRDIRPLQEWVEHVPAGRARALILSRQRGAQGAGALARPPSAASMMRAAGPAVGQAATSKAELQASAKRLTTAQRRMTTAGGAMAAARRPSLAAGSSLEEERGGGGRSTGTGGTALLARLEEAAGDGGKRAGSVLLPVPVVLLWAAVPLVHLLLLACAWAWGWEW